MDNLDKDIAISALANDICMACKKFNSCTVRVKPCITIEYIAGQLVEKGYRKSEDNKESENHV